MHEKIYYTRSVIVIGREEFQCRRYVARYMVLHKYFVTVTLRRDVRENVNMAIDLPKTSIELMNKTSHVRLMMVGNFATYHRQSPLPPTSPLYAS